MEKITLSEAHIQKIQPKADQLGLTIEQYVRRALVLALNIDTEATDESWVVIENNGDILLNLPLNKLNKAAQRPLSEENLINTVIEDN